MELREAETRRLPVLDDVASGAGAEPLPELYDGWLRELLSGTMPREIEATCSDCAMCDRDPRLRGPMGSDFDASVKCCSYLPTLPNFLVGMILSDESEGSALLGRDSVRRRMADVNATTPLGLIMKPSYRVVYDLTQPATFGHSGGLVCPHYQPEDGGKCGIWKYRNSTCSTWFCKHVRGGTGRNVWKRIRELLAAVETELAVSCAMHFGIGADAVTALVRSMSAMDTEVLKRDLLPDAATATARRHWGRWLDRKEAFYRACGNRARSLSWSEVASLCGATVQARATLAREEYRRMQDPPNLSRLRLAPTPRWRFDADTECIGGYASTDPVLLAAPVASALARFDGRRSTGEVVADMAVLDGVELADSELRRLVDFGVLLDGGKSG
jgi:hypothetical protein